jgi:hypothetical protein
MRNVDACLYVRPRNHATLERRVADGKTTQKIVACARIVLLSGRGFGTNAIQREARVSKPTEAFSSGPPKPIPSWRKMHGPGGRWKKPSRGYQLNESGSSTFEVESADS